MKFNSIIAAFCIIIILPVCFSNRAEFKIYASDGHSHAGAIVSISAATVIIGTASFVLVRYLKRESLHADSIITFINNRVKTADSLYKKDDFTGSEAIFQKINSQWNEYDKCRKKRRVQSEVTQNEITEKIADCQLLQNISPKISYADSLTLMLPLNEDTLLTTDRHEILSLVNSVQEEISRCEAANPGKLDQIHYGFRRSIEKIHTIDSLYKTIYSEAQLNFRMKSKFYFNQTFEKKDTAALKLFVEDCDYYDVNKEWCERARKALNAGFESEVFVTKSSEKKTKNRFASIDSMYGEYLAAMKSANIDILQKFLNRYEKKSKKQNPRIENVRKMLDSLKIESKKSDQSDKSYPLLNDLTPTKIKLVFKGIPDSLQSVLENSFDELHYDFKNAQGVRSPATVLVDISTEWPMLILTANVNTKEDVVYMHSSDAMKYVLPGYTWGMEVLQKFRSTMLNSIDTIKKSDSLKAIQNKLTSATYVVRLKKNESENCTMYAYESSDSKLKPVFFDFFEISTVNQKNVRLQNKIAPVILENKNNVSDSTKNRLIDNFFR